VSRVLHKIHRVGACVLGAFLTLHLLNHLLAIGGPETHIRFMEAFRAVYRNRVVEVILLLCAASQVASGLTFVRRRWRDRHQGLDLLQLGSGLYLAFFLLVHVGAVLAGRMKFGLDTNFYYAAAGMHVLPYRYFFMPYYFLAVLAITVHLTRALHWLGRDRLSPAAMRIAATTLSAAGFAAATLIVAAFSGGLYGITVPARYLATFQ
jgi:succinate dehydrogenase/fumarate reductase cytochrome b subunit